MMLQPFRVICRMAAEIKFCSSIKLWTLEGKFIIVICDLSILWIYWLQKRSFIDLMYSDY